MNSSATTMWRNDSVDLFQMPPESANAWLIVILLIVELAFNMAALPVSLKFILLCQCATILSFSIVRIVEFVAKMATGDIACQPFFFYILHSFSIVLRNFLGANFLFERIIATIYARNYENGRNTAYTLLGFSASIIASGISCYFGIDQSAPTMISKRAIPVMYAITLLVFFSIVTWYFVYKYNCRRYSIIGCKIQIQDLSERYQLSENIRTFRQLTPTLVLHTLNDYFTIAAYFIAVSEIIRDAGIWLLLNAFVYVILAASNLLIEISIIIFHPTLFRFAYRKLLAFHCCRHLLHRTRVHSIKTIDVPKNINGKALVNEQNQEDYFKMLEGYWRK